jgi:hypothetical protein
MGAGIGNDLSTTVEKRLSTTGRPLMENADDRRGLGVPAHHPTMKQWVGHGHGDQSI